jgi:hypothetical protein
MWYTTALHLQISDFDRHNVKARTAAPRGPDNSHRHPEKTERSPTALHRATWRHNFVSTLSVYARPLRHGGWNRQIRYLDDGKPNAIILVNKRNEIVGGHSNELKIGVDVGNWHSRTVDGS